MLRLATKSVLGNALRLALTALAVVLGVSFVSGTFVLTDSIDAAFDDLFDTVSAGVDAYVNPVSEFGDVGAGPPGLDTSGGSALDEAILQDVRAVEGVARAEGLVQGIATVIGPDGEPIGGNGPPTIGLSFVEQEGATELREGEAPSADDHVVLDVTTASENGFELGDTVRVLLPSGPEEFTLVGTSGFGEEDSLLGATTASFTLERAQELFDKPGQLDQVVVVAAEDVDTAALVDALDAAVGSDTVEVVSVDEQIASQTAEIDEGLAFLDIVLLSFAGVSLFVGAYLIVNTFSIVVAQRMREFALLRAVGASARQLRGMVIAEAGLIGLVGGTLGLLGGIGLSESLQAVFELLGTPFPDGGIVLRPRTFVASYAISMVVTLAAALLPAMRAARVAPVEALRGTGAGAEVAIGRTRTLLGAAALLGGVAALLVGLFTDTSEPAAFVGGGVGGMFVGVSLLAPWIAPPVVTGLGRLLGGSVPARLARRNAARNPTRTSTTASALMVGVALISFVSVMASSVQASVAALLEDAFRADVVLSAQGGFGTLPRTLAAELEGIDGIESVAVQRLAPGRDADGEELFVTGVSAAVFLDHFALGAEQSSMDALVEDGTVLVREDVAQEQGLAVGDTVTLDLPAASGEQLEVVGTWSEDGIDGRYAIGLATYERTVGPGADSGVSVRYVEGADSESVRAAIEEVAAAYPGTDVQDLAQLLESFQENIDALLNIMIGLLVLALIIALIGIVNTLALSVIERTREIGLLRAVGMVRRQVRGTVRRESVIVAMFGALLGVVLGTFFGWALVTSLASEGIEVLVVPATRLTVYVVIAAIAGVVAALLPARRAARMDVLQAVTTE